MRLQVFILVIWISIASTAQSNVYHPFPDSNAVWTEASQGCCWFDCPDPPTPNPILADSEFSNYLQGDTLINGSSYHKVYRSGQTHTHCAFGNSVDYWTPIIHEYVGAYRQDTAQRRVFFVDAYSPDECILYDFNASVGDTISQCQFYCGIVGSIDSVLVGNTYRKRLNIANENFSVIEGIGSTSGLSGPLCPFEYWEMLICFIQDGQTLFPDTGFTCQLLTEVHEAALGVRTMKVAPNPFSMSTIVETDRPLSNGELFVFNAFGQEVERISGIKGQTIELYSNDLPQGIYFIQLVENKKIIASKKIMITR